MARVNRRKLKLSDVEITIDAEGEDMGLEGHFDDKETEREIIESYESGNGYAWCCAIVRATWTHPDGTVLTGRDTLGGVACLPTENKTAEQEFESTVKDHGMQEQALADLQREVNEHDKRKLERDILDELASLSATDLKRGITTRTVVLELRRRAIK